MICEYKKDRAESTVLFIRRRINEAFALCYSLNNKHYSVWDNIEPAFNRCLFILHENREIPHIRSQKNEAVKAAQPLLHCQNSKKNK